MVIGYLKGKYILITNPKRYIYLTNIRGNFFSLYRKKRKFLKLIKKNIKQNKLSNVQIISRVKTIGSIDRKEKYKQIKYKQVIIPYLQDDLIGVKFFVNKKEDCYKLIELIKDIAPFVNLKNKINPRDYFLSPTNCNKTNANLKNCITGNVLFEDSLIHIFILLKSDKSFQDKERIIYLRDINSVIKDNKNNISKQ
jgi:hypothetical protein